MPFLSPNQQCQNTEGNIAHNSTVSRKPSPRPLVVKINKCRFLSAVMPQKWVIVRTNKHVNITNASATTRQSQQTTETARSSLALFYIHTVYTAFFALHIYAPDRSGAYIYAPDLAHCWHAFDMSNKYYLLTYLASLQISVGSFWHHTPLCVRSMPRGQVSAWVQWNGSQTRGRENESKSQWSTYMPLTTVQLITNSCATSAKIHDQNCFFITPHPGCFVDWVFCMN